MDSLAVVTLSPRVTYADLVTMCRAVSYQIRRHVAPAWSRASMAVVPFAAPEHVPAGMPVLRVLPNDASEPDALGWHTEDAKGAIFGDVMVDPVLDNGGSVLHTANSVSAVLSHEALEIFCDRAVSTWDQMPDGTMVAHEVCDPVENDSYDALGASVSNFVFPEWFDPQAPPGARLDQLGKLTSPFSMTPGGYLVEMRPAIDQGQPTWKITSIFGRDFPEWKKQMKLAKAARMTRRCSSIAFRNRVTPVVVAP